MINENYGNHMFSFLFQEIVVNEKRRNNPYHPVFSRNVEDCFDIIGRVVIVMCIERLDHRTNS